MSTSTFPTSKDTFTDPSSTTVRSATGGISPAAVATLANDALAAVENTIGITGSTDQTSYNFKVNSLITAAQTVLTDTGSANTYVVTPSPAYTAYAKGQTFCFYPANANTSTSTLNVNGLGTKAIQYNGNALISGELPTTALVTVKYDGTAFQLLSPVPVTNGAVTTTFIDSGSDDGNNVTATAGSWVDITNMTATIPTAAGSNVNLSWAIPFDNTSSAGTSLIRIVDTISAVQTTVFKYSAAPGSVGPRLTIGGSLLIKNVAAGTHAYKMQMQMLAGGGATARAFYGQSTFSAEERKS